MKTIQQLNVSVICGGQSSEHDISLRSAQFVVNQLVGMQCSVQVIWIDLDGRWWALESASSFVSQGIADKFPLVLTPGSSHPWQSLLTNKPIAVDVVFPLVHGETGEDGCLQGLLTCLGVPFVGANVLASALCMHKDMAKRLWRDAGLPTCDWVTVSRHDKHIHSYAELAARWGNVLFVKPAGQGSSYGVTRVTSEAEFGPAIDQALSFHDCALIEPAVIGTEVECAIKGYGDQLSASVLGELEVHHDFYSFDAKYNDPQGARAIIPARLDSKRQQQIQQLALQACRVLSVEGMARVDFFVNDQHILLNEINTIPGFTSISLYPKNWQATGLSTLTLLSDLLLTAFEQRTVIPSSSQTTRDHNP